MRLEELRDFGLSASHVMVRRSTRDFGAKVLGPVVDQYEREGRYPCDLIARRGELGMLGIRQYEASLSTATGEGNR